MTDPRTDDALGVLDRMTLILEAFDEDDRGLGISELAARSGLPKSTVSRLVSTLVRQRYLERDGRRVQLGLRLFEMGQLARAPHELRLAALPVLTNLRSRTHESVHLAIRDGQELVCIAAMRGRPGAPLAARTGGRLPMHATALGKAVLAHAPATDLDALAADGLRSWTPSTITDRELLAGQLAGIRRGLLAVAMRELLPGVSCVASPILTTTGRLVGAISASGCADGFDVDAVAPEVRAAAVAVTRRL
ncbi:IclR family transcriptional regulator [Microbacterium sp. SS28]|uniref:IclR family transcriptional regulator n=1 Tax=Microbacterium sp. SS28 TaxID=2919948 RepID=UPI001FAADE8F|nr:IclR family transcriptional regulator [Microbacterium sp. SS28]